MREEAEHSRAVEDYLKAVYKLERHAASVSTSALAEELDRTAASITNMVKGLADRGLLEHVPYYGVRLTASGRRAALTIIRRHRILETYLIERLGFGWEDVHAEAERLEHAASDVLIERMALALGNPAVDPHGAPIPSSEGDIERRDWETLSDLPAGRRAVIREVPDEDANRLRLVSSLGLLLGTRIEIVRFERGAAEILVDSALEPVSVPDELAGMILVERSER